MVDSLEQWSPDGNWSEDVYDRINFDAVINPQDLEETYTQGFKRAISEGGAGGIMYYSVQLFECDLPRFVGCFAYRSTDVRAGIRVTWLTTFPLQRHPT